MTTIQATVYRDGVKNGRDRSEGRVASQGLHVGWVMNVVAS